MTLPENQKLAWMEMNEITSTIFYNQRVIISEPREEPVCWKCSKVEDMGDRGIIRLTFAQDQWNAKTDFIEKDADGNIVGMWAGYYDINENPAEDPTPPPPTIHAVITYSGTTAEIKTGGSYKKLTVDFYNVDDPAPYQDGVWSFKINGEDAADLVTVLTAADSTSLNENQIKVKFIGGDSYIGETLEVGFASNDGIKTTLLMNIVGL